MSTKNAPPRWNEIAAIARDCGAGDWAMRKWLARCEIPAAWKLRILERSSGDLSLDDMVITASSDEEESAA